MSALALKLRRPARKLKAEKNRRSNRDHLGTLSYAAARSLFRTQSPQIGRELMRRRNLHQSPSYIPSIRATAQTQRGHLESCGFVQGKRLGQYSELPESWDACRDDLRSDRWPAERPLTVARKKSRKQSPPLAASPMPTRRATIRRSSSIARRAMQ